MLYLIISIGLLTFLIAGVVMHFKGIEDLKRYKKWEGFSE